MLKRVVFIGLIILGLSSIVSAQSGRRIKTAPTPVPTEKQAEPDAGYSESSPSRSIPIFAKSRSNKKPQLKNKDDKETDQPQEDETLPTDNPENESDDELIKIESALITVPVAVYNRSGIYVPGLSKDNFKIFENGQEQEIAYFGVDDKPFTVLMVLDLSGSTTYKIEDIRAAARAFVDQLKPQDSVMVISFDERVSVLTDVTTDRQKIYKAINRTNFGGGTSLYDAVETSLGKRLRKIEGRKAIVLFTDGVDTTSFHSSYESTLRDADEADALIFPIYYNTFLNVRGISTGEGPMTSTPTLGMPGGMGGRIPKGARAEDYARGRQYLDDLATLTGGRVFRPETTPGGLNAAFEGIAEELRTQYNIGYYPVEVGKNGERKEIRVRVNRPNLAIRARDSYIVGSNSK
jgi:VWFA-related protein